MPCLYIMSLFEKRKRKYGGRIKKVRQDLADFLDAFESQAGAEAASVIRAYAAVPRCYFLNSDDAGDADDQDAFSAVGRLARQEAAAPAELARPTASTTRGGSRRMSSGTTGLTGTISARCSGKTGGCPCSTS